MSDRTPEYSQIECQYMSDRMPDRMPEYMSGRMPDRVSAYMSDRMSDRMSEYTSDSLSEYIEYMIKYTSWWGSHEVK